MLGGSSSLAATLKSVQDQLTGIGTLGFSERLQDAAEESVFVEIPMTVSASEFIADASHCQLSYRQRVERNGVVDDQKRTLSFRDIDKVVVQPFEIFENQRNGKPGFIYSYTTPQIMTLVAAHSDASFNWFAFTDSATANQVATGVRQVAARCHRQ
jgi:hypothetical protein